MILPILAYFSIVGAPMDSDGCVICNFRHFESRKCVWRSPTFHFDLVTTIVEIHFSLLWIIFHHCEIFCIHTQLGVKNQFSAGTSLWKIHFSHPTVCEYNIFHFCEKLFTFVKNRIPWFSFVGTKTSPRTQKHSCVGSCIWYCVCMWGLLCQGLALAAACPYAGTPCV